jgi:flagellar hook-basal body complex protein FliE
MSEGINLAARVAYNNVVNSWESNRPEIKDAKISGSVSFHEMVKAEFNNYVSMSPEQILARIKGIRSIVGPEEIAGFGGVISDASNNLKKHERVARAATINEASLLELLTAANDASNTLRIMVTYRDKAVEALEKIMNMQV